MRPSLVLGAASGLLALAAFSATAAPPTSITLDGSLGHGVGAVNPTSPGFYQITPSMGMSVGSNLFQSFGVFNLGTGDTADFLGNAGTQNIIARVTGGSASNIDGTMESAANLYFINPAGIMFTANAALNVNGAFVASTANYAKLSDGTIFYADVNHPVNDAGLTSAPISAFGFLNATPQPVTFTGPQLTNAGGIHVIAGDITLDQGTPNGGPEQGTSLLAPGGNLTLFSAASAGEVSFSLASPGAGFASATNTAFGNITMQNGSSAAIDSTQGGGSVVIRGGKLTVDRSAINSNNSSPVAGGNISVQANQLNVQDEGQIASSTNAGGNAGDVSVQTESLDVDGSAAPTLITGIFSYSNPGASGNGGRVTVTATEAMAIQGGGQIASNTFSSGNAGEVTVQAASLTIDGTAAPGYFTGITSGSETGATGNGGDISVTTTGAISIQGGGEISASTFTSGNAGEATVHAASLTIDGSASPDYVSGIFSESDSSDPSAVGNAGSVTVDIAGALTLVGTGQLVTDTFTAGHAGDLTVNAGSISIDGSADPGELTGITSNSEPGVTGNGGDVTVTATGAISIQGAGEISASTFSAGNAGEVTVQAASLTIDGLATPGYFTGIASEATPQSSNNCGAVTVTVSGLISLTAGGEIGSNAFSSGNAGEVTVHAGSLAIDGSATPDYLTGISSASEPGASGNGGQVTVTASDAVSIQGGGQIASNTYSSGNGGDVAVTANGAISIQSQGEITAGTFSSGHAGEVTVQAATLVIDGSATPGYFTGITSDSEPGASGDGGQVSVTASGVLSILGGGEIASNTFSPGNAGDATVQAGSLVIDGSATPAYLTGISSDSETGATGNGGDLSVTVTDALSILGGGLISAGTSSSGKSGEVTVRAATLVIDGSATPGYFTGIATNADASSSNDGGDVGVTVRGLLIMTGGGGIASNTFSSGDAGEVTVQAGSLTINGLATPDYLTGISSISDSNNASSPGKAGSVTVTVAGALGISNSGEIEVTTYTAGQGGDVLVRAGSITIDGSGTPDYITGIAAQATGAGNGGDLIAMAGSVALSGGATISSSSSESDAGNILIDTANLSLQGNSNIDTSAGAKCGSISLNVGGLVYLLDSKIESAADGGAGTTGGDITIDPQFVVLDDSTISANDLGGTGGNISIITDDFLNNDSAITATGATSGSINISAPDLNLSGSLLPLPAVLESDEKRLRESCARSVKHEYSSLIVVGRGGTELAPDELQPDFGLGNF